MRTWARSLLVLVPALSPAPAGATVDDDEPPGVHVRVHDEHGDEPLLHLDPTLFDSARAEGGLVDGNAATLSLGPHARLSAEATWWQTGLAPSMFADDLPIHGWRAAAELSYDLGPFRVGVNASLGRNGDLSHRMVGLFAFRTFKLSRWMTAWIALGLAWEQWDTPALARPRQGATIGLTLGTTFR